VVHALSLGLVLSITWLLLSGIYDNPLILGLGVVSVVIVVLITRRMNVIDHEGHPVHLSAGVVTYWPWLLLEILKANVDVARRVLSRTPDISPTLLHLPTRLDSDLARVTYANSITLTPGTVSICVDPGMFVVHSLTREGAASLEEGEMERRVDAFISERAR
jgi:multicomponent Na+:H+ antiporter subunit E